MKAMSFAEAEKAGRAMYDRCIAMGATPQWEEHDAAWADLARVAWESVREQRRGA